MNSHEYANKLKELGDFLLAKPEFETPWSESNAYIGLYYWGGKDGFLSAVKALGTGTKEWGKDDLRYIPAGTDMLRLNISRASVCRLVKEAEYECEPLLSQAEEAEIGA